MCCSVLGENRSAHFARHRGSGSVGSGGSGGVCCVFERVPDLWQARRAHAQTGSRCARVRLHVLGWARSVCRAPRAHVHCRLRCAPRVAPWTSRAMGVCRSGLRLRMHECVPRARARACASARGHGAAHPANDAVFAHMAGYPQSRPSGRKRELAPWRVRLCKSVSAHASVSAHEAGTYTYMRLAHTHTHLCAVHAPAHTRALGTRITSSRKN